MAAALRERCCRREHERHTYGDLRAGGSARAVRAGVSAGDRARGTDCSHWVPGALVSAEPWPRSAVPEPAGPVRAPRPAGGGLVARVLRGLRVLRRDLCLVSAVPGVCGAVRPGAAVTRRWLPSVRRCFLGRLRSDPLSERLEAVLQEHEPVVSAVIPGVLIGMFAQHDRAPGRLESELVCRPGE